MRTTLGMLVLFVAMIGCVRPQTRPESRTPLESPHERALNAIVAAINTGDPETLMSLYGPLMRQHFPREKTLQFLKELREKGGAIQGAQDDATAEKVETKLYQLRAERGEWQLKLALGVDGSIAGFTISIPPTTPVVARTKVPMRLPFSGRWVVAWGGDTQEKNQHLVSQSQRRAADLLGIDDEGRTHGGDGKRNQDYFCFGREILSAAPGEVLAAIDGVPDNLPGTMNSLSAVGNLVMIQQGPGEVALYAHLERGSVRVKAGERVEFGQVLGRCGNSGNSSEPHLHFHVQDSPTLGEGWGVEAVFDKVDLDRQGTRSAADGYSFVKGDRIAPANPN